jgi:hypothetical protein
MQTNSSSGVPPAELGDFESAQSEMQRFWFSCRNGHEDYVRRNRRNYRYFHGDGGHWSDDDRAFMESVQGRKCFEINLSKQAVLTAVGEQIATRADITYKPKKGKASADTAVIWSKLAKHFLDQNNFHILETDAWESGLIAERGYYDIRMCFDGNLNGEIKITLPDPVTVIPDIFATEYDPKEWPGVMRFMWLTLDEIAGMYGDEARETAKKDWENYRDRPLTDEFPVENASDLNYGFGTSPGAYYQWWDKETGELRLRVIERQFYKREMALHFIDMTTGDTEVVPHSMGIKKARQYAADNGLLLQKMEGKVLYWRVVTATTVLFDEQSPYKTPTIIPFFYLFNKGKTGSMIADAISPQDLLNKSVSAVVHYLTTVANSGWQVEEGQLTNMTTADLANVGMKTGVVIERKAGTQPLQKITPNTFPTGMDRLCERGEAWVKAATGMSDAEQGLNSPEVSGIAIGMKQFQSKLQLAKPLSNLQFTRTLVGRKIIELGQQFLTNERIYKITGQDDYGRPKEEELIINQVDEFGNILNDITVGEYEVEVSTQPMAATYEESQFKQLGEMREKMKVAIPDDEIVRRSNISNKHDLADRIANPQDNGTQQAQAAMLEKQLEELSAKVELLKAQRTKVVAEATNTNIQAMFGATNAGRVIAMTPGVAPLADELMLSGGFEDHNAAPVIPQNVPQLTHVQPITPKNTSPNFPPQADRGVTAGIESGNIPTIPSIAE